LNGYSLSGHHNFTDSKQSFAAPICSFVPTGAASRDMRDGAVLNSVCCTCLWKALAPHVCNSIYLGSSSSFLITVILFDLNRNFSLGLLKSTDDMRNSVIGAYIRLCFTDVRMHDCNTESHAGIVIKFLYCRPWCILAYKNEVPRT
jgi:hypothetical protein